jgi:hypothetical protein
MVEITFADPQCWQHEAPPADPVLGALRVDTTDRRHQRFDRMMMMPLGHLRTPLLVIAVPPGALRD